MGSRAKRKSKHKLMSKKNISISEVKDLPRESSPHESSNTVECSNFEPRRSSCCSDINLVFHKRLPISIISQHDFEADPTRTIRTSRDSGTRSDELETLLFQSTVDEFMKSSIKDENDSEINNTFFPTLLTEISKIEQDLRLKLASINSCVLSGSNQQSDHLDQPEELSSIKPSGNASVLSDSHQMDEQLTMEQTTEEISTHCPSETNSIESSKGKHRHESPDRLLTQDCHEKQEFDDTSSLVVDSGSEEDAAHDNGTQVTKPKRKRAKRKKKKLTNEDESKNTYSELISGSDLSIDVTEEESDLMTVLNYYTEKCLTLTNDIDLYSNIAEYNYFIFEMFKQKPSVITSLTPKFQEINSPAQKVHKLKDPRHHFVQSVFYYILLGRLTPGRDKLQRYFNSLPDNAKSQKSHDFLLNESNLVIMNYFRIVADNGNTHPVVWYLSLRELASNIKKVRPFLEPEQSCNDWADNIRHWSDIILHFTCCDECLPYDDLIESLVAGILEGSEDYRKEALDYWQSIRRLPWICAVATLNLNKAMGIELKSS